VTHFYHKLDDGVIKPRHYTPYAKPRYDSGGFELKRPSTISDLRKWLKNGENCAPSVTTVLDVLAKPALVNWQIDRYLMAAYEMDIADDFEYDQWAIKVKIETQSRMDKAPQAGTDFHKLMENYLGSLRFKGVTDKQWEMCQDVSNLILDKTGISNEHWQPEVNIFSELGYAGQTDLLINEDWILDYKTKENKEKFKPGKMAYDNHAQQLAAYRAAIAPKARCANIFVCLETGEIDWHEWDEEDLIKGFKVFNHCLKIYQINNKL